MRIGRLEIKMSFTLHNAYPFGWKKKVKQIITETKRDCIKFGEFFVDEDGDLILYWKIPAIKKCRDTFKPMWSLREAKDNVEMIEASMPKVSVGYNSEKNYINDPRI